jgi:hypothetical protein
MRIDPFEALMMTFNERIQSLICALDGEDDRRVRELIEEINRMYRGVVMKYLYIKRKGGDLSSIGKKVGNA